MSENKAPISFSPVIVGTMRLGRWGENMTTTQLDSYVRTCLDMGLTDFDHADIYGHYTTESDFGNLLRKHPELRHQMQITTKCGIRMIAENRPAHKVKSYDLSKAHIIASVENSLRELSTDYIDLLLLHRPDLLMEPDEIAEAFAELKTLGKVNQFGVSNFSSSQFEMLNAYTPLVTNQVEISILHLSAFTDGVLDRCQQHNAVPTAWSPFGGGRLFTDTGDPRVSRIRKVAEELAETHNARLDQVLLAWLGKHPAGIVPVVGTSKIERVKAAQEAMSIQLTREEWYRLWEASTGEEVA